MGAVMAWFGASILVLADARRGFAFGLLLVAAGLSLERLAEGGWQPALLLAAGGLTAALVGLRRTHRPGWGGTQRPGTQSLPELWAGPEPGLAGSSAGGCPPPERCA